MRNRRFDVAAALVSFGAAALVFALFLGIYSWIPKISPFLEPLFTGFALMLAAAAVFGALAVLNRIRSTKVEMPPLFSGFTALMLALLLVAGAAGEAVYSLDFSTQRVKVGEDVQKEKVRYEENADIVLLLDDSGSMYNAHISEVFREGCDTLIDSVSENCRMSGCVFADEAEDGAIIDLAKMDNNGKAKLKETIHKQPGGRAHDNDFYGALDIAYEMLKNAGGENRHCIIVMFTDGIEMGSLLSHRFSQEQNEKLLSAGIEVYSVRPNQSADLCSDTFKDLVTENGAYPERDNIVPINGGALDLSGVIDVLNDVTQREEERETITPIYQDQPNFRFTEGTLLYDNRNPVSPYRTVVRLVAMAVISFLLQLLFFRKLHIGLLPGIGAGLIAALLSSLGGAVSVWGINVIAIALLMYTVFAFLEISDGITPIAGVRREV